MERTISVIGGGIRLKIVNFRKKLIGRRFVCMLILLASAGFLMGSSGESPGDQAGFWKAKVFEAHGDIDALERVASLVFSGTIVTRGDSGTVTLALARPGKLRTTMKYTRKYEDRILLGNKGWRDFGEGFQEADGHSLAAMIFQYNHLNLPMGLLDDRLQLSYTQKSSAGKSYPVFEVAGGDGPPMAIIIDPESGLIRQVNGRISLGDNQVMMGVVYLDYRKIDGIMLPHRIINYVNGVAIAESRYDTVQVNVQLAPDFFSTNNTAAEK